MKNMLRLFTFLMTAALLLAACPGSTAPAAPTASATATTVVATQPLTTTNTSTTTTASSSNGKDLLADITTRGVLRVSTDPAYPPQSELVEGATKPATSKCTGEEHTAGEFKGFDIAVAVEIAKRLGVEPCFVTPDWTLIIAGKWSGRWDLSVGSMAITPERLKVLYFSQPYYTTPAGFFVHQDNKTFTKIEDLAGKKIGVGTGNTYESYLNGTLQIPGEPITLVVKGADIHGYDTDTAALQDLALGDGTRLDAVMTALPTGQGFAKSGKPIKQLGDTVFLEYLSAAIDRSSSLDSTAFRAKVTETIQAMHTDGTLKKLSEQYYGIDLVTAAATFDLTKIKQ